MMTDDASPLRAAKYGVFGAIGVIFISLGTFVVSRAIWADRIYGHEGRAMDNILIVWILGVAVTILFLFFVIGAFLNRELEARGLSHPEE